MVWDSLDLLQRPDFTLLIFNVQCANNNNKNDKNDTIITEQEKLDANVLFCFFCLQVRISSWPKENPGSWFSEFKRGKMVSFIFPGFSSPLYIKLQGRVMVT